MNLARLTIRARITGGSLLIAILISIVAGIIIFTQVERIVSDGQLLVLDNIESPYLTALSQEGTDEVDPPGAGQLVAVVAPGGDLHVDTLPAALTASLDSLVARPDGTRTVSSAGETFLVRVTTVSTSAGEWKVITASRDGLEKSVLNKVAFLLIASIAGINLAFGAASWFIGTAALGPVGRLRRSAATLVVSPGDEMLPVGPAQDEISDLAVTLNELIRQLRSSAERERQIVSDASHEIRTPLAIIQTQLELAQRQASTLPQMQADVTAAQHTLARLSALATSMLELSRIDAQASPGSARAEELAAELADAADRGRKRVGHRDIRIEYSSPPTLAKQTVAVSEADFGRVCDNLVNNALAAIEENGLIELSLDLGDHGLRLRVRDDAGGMDEAFVPLAFDRFSRADHARTGGGAGLGLSIVAGIVSLAAGSIRLDNRPGSGLTVDVTFPFV
ncbi:MAG: HAMP domain-containing histidine kinase [Salinibacterium sp.]|nr:HAMP domain-containing histidine kinase [Salinibacterium sp.]